MLEFGSLLWLKNKRRPVSGLRHLLILWVLISVHPFLAGCRQANLPQTNIIVEHEVKPQPVKVGPSTITLRLSDAGGTPYKGAQVRLEANMSHPGMRPIFSDAKEVGPGSYEAPIEMTMGGDWIILVHITLPQGRKLQRQFEIKGVESR